MENLTTEELNTIIEQCQNTFTEIAIKLAEAVRELERRSEA